MICALTTEVGMVKGPYRRLDHAQVWAFYAGGQLPAEIGRTLGRPPDAIYAMIYKAGGIRPAPRVRSPRQLSLAEREEISRGLAAGQSCRAIARRLGRAASTVTREIAANGCRHRYRAVKADEAALQRARRPKVCKLAARPELAMLVSDKLKRRWSPEQMQDGCDACIPTIRPSGCRTRRSTGRCSCRPGVRCGTS
jgi:DNA-binding CsgD family transcriptional regulator